MLDFSTFQDKNWKVLAKKPFVLGTSISVKLAFIICIIFLILLAHTQANRTQAAGQENPTVLLTDTYSHLGAFFIFFL